MRIAHLFGGLPPRHTDHPDLRVMVEDHGVWLKLMMGQLAERGHRVRVHLPYPFAGRLVSEGVEWRCYRPLSRSSLFRDGKEMNPRFLLDLVSWRPQIVHFHILTYDWSLFLASYFFGWRHIPFVAQHHGEPIPSPARRHRRWAIGHGLKRARMVIFQTAEDRDAWTRVFHAGSTRVIPSGYSSVFSRGDREEARRKTGMEGEPLVLWVGYLGARKDPLTVLRGFRRFAEHFPGATLHFVGDGSLEERLRGEASADPILADRTILHGAMPQRLVPDFYRSADIFVLGSRSEGFCGACLEAMACGVVPVVTDVSGFRGVTDRGRVGLLYPPGDSDALAAALTKLTLNSRLRLRMAEEALEWVVQFRWDRIAERLEALYAELLENPFKAPHPPSGPSRMRV